MSLAKRPMTQANRLTALEVSSKKFGGVLKGVAVAAGAAAVAAGAAAVKLAKDVVAGYAEYEQLVGGVDTLFANLLYNCKNTQTMPTRQQDFLQMPTWKLLQVFQQA